jgi:hypothetical protein
MLLWNVAYRGYRREWRRAEDTSGAEAGAQRVLAILPAGGSKNNHFNITGYSYNLELASAGLGKGLQPWQSGVRHRLVLVLTASQCRRRPEA